MLAPGLTCPPTWGRAGSNRTASNRTASNRTASNRTARRWHGVRSGSIWMIMRRRLPDGSPQNAIATNTPLLTVLGMSAPKAASRLPARVLRGVGDVPRRGPDQPGSTRRAARPTGTPAGYRRV